MGVGQIQVEFIPELEYNFLRNKMEPAIESNNIDVCDEDAAVFSYNYSQPSVVS